MNKPRDWLDPLIVVADADSVEQPRRRVLQFIGVRISDDLPNDRTIINAASPTIETTDDTPAYADLVTLAVGDVAQVDVLVKIAKADGSVRQSFKLSAIYYGAAGPTATIDGSVGSAGAGTGSALAELVVTGAKVRLKITGISATNLTTTYEAHVI